MEKAKRCIFLTGAPRHEALRWDEDKLDVNFEASIQRFLGTQDASSNQAMSSTPFGSYAKWRSVECDNTVPRVSTKSHTRTKDQIGNDASTLNITSHLSDNDFLEHSLAVLEDLDVSQIIGTTTGEDGNEETTELLSFATTTSTDTSTHLSNTSFFNASPSQLQRDPEAVPLKLPGGITDLSHLPHAAHITRIKPQTITINLLVGIIALSPTRTVTLRHPRPGQNPEMDILELTVGDDTRAGFGVSFWLVPTPTSNRAIQGALSRAPDEELRQQLNGLRAGEVVLLTNVALTCWRGRVYGQSLSRRFARNKTKVVVLGGRDAGVLAAPVVAKLRRVRGWVADFVGVARGREGTSFDDRGRSAKKGRDEELPPDTQD